LDHSLPREGWKPTTFASDLFYTHRELVRFNKRRLARWAGQGEAVFRLPSDSLAVGVDRARREGLTARRTNLRDHPVRALKLAGVDGSTHPVEPVRTRPRLSPEDCPRRREDAIGEFDGAIIVEVNVDERVPIGIDDSEQDAHVPRQREELHQLIFRLDANVRPTLRARTLGSRHERNHVEAESV